MMLGALLLLALAQPAMEDIPMPPGEDCKSMCEFAVKQCKESCKKQGGKKAAGGCDSSCAGIRKVCEEECKAEE